MHVPILVHTYTYTRNHYHVFSGGGGGGGGGDGGDGGDGAAAAASFFHAIVAVTCLELPIS